MRLYSALKTYLSCLNDNDICVFGNHLLSSFAVDYHRDGFIYSNSTNKQLMSYSGIGIAYSTNKRVFIIVREGDLLEDMSLPFQIAASKLKNIFYVIFNANMYDGVQIETQINNIYALKGVLFNMGLIVHDYTKYLKDKSSINNMRNIISTLVGPLGTIINTDWQRQQPKDLSDDVFDMYKLNSYIVDESIGTSAFISPKIGNIS